MAGWDTKPRSWPELSTVLVRIRNAVSALEAGGGPGPGGGGGSSWGSITGTLSSQTDLQSALNGKAPINNPTFTGSVGGITKSMVGLGNVDNTADLDKPVSTATQTALNAKLDDTQFDGLTKITVGTTAPSSPATGDLWIDTN